ncbi:MAG: class I SAM-dependent methyltransferase [Oscillospiraceae bacterium]|nr:class I SAM-dependent methyltransferase [Oscillospiraceae bacterium]
MQFGVLAGYYDLLNYNADYKKAADFIEGLFEFYDKKNNNTSVLDLACGTGRLTVELADRGYDMTGLDLSADMLAFACIKEKKSNKAKEILWLNQDMTSFELYGTVDAVICCHDSLNYILKKRDIKKCFDLVYNYLNPGGLFIFDVNSKYKYNNIYGENNIILENTENTGNNNRSVFCSWKNYYNKNKKTCDFYIDLFAGENNIYKRYTESQRQKYHGAKFLRRTLENSGFGDINICFDFEFYPGKKNRYKSKGKGKGKNKSKSRICFCAVKK